jgi:FixJ family two-component response regulator
MAADRILFVDDEKGVLDGYERLLRKDFYVSVASSGQEGLVAIAEHGPFGVVISDMRMPGMSGSEFLSQVKQKAPDTIRMLLTGYTDLSAAIDAVNEGNIFRFLTKPSSKEVLVEAINIGLGQYHLLTAEKELVKKAQTFEHAKATWETQDICQWDNFEGPTGLPGPSQAREYLAPLLGVDSQCYVVLLKITTFETLEKRYGEGLAGDFLNVIGQFLVEAFQSGDRLFHWGRDVLMAVVRRRISPAAVRTDIARLTSARREHVMDVNGRSVMIGSPITFDMSPVLQFSTFDEMLAGFDTDLSGRL